MDLFKVINVSKWFPTSSGRFYALKKVSFSLPASGLVAIKGKSGSGKSTLLNILSGLDSPSSGRVFYKGKDVKKSKRRFLGEEGMIVFQHYNLIDGLSLVDNVSLPLKIAGRRKKRGQMLIKALGLSPLSKKDIAKLSGGEKQRTALARCLAMDPDVIFADEPTGALDEANSKVVMDILKKASAKKLVVLVSHNEKLIADYAERVITIKDGSVVSDEGEVTALEGVQNKKKLHGHRMGWTGKVIFKNLRRHAIKNAICFFSGFIGFSALLLSVGFLMGNGPAMEEESAKTLHRLKASLTYEVEHEIPGSSLKLISQERPSYDDARKYLRDLDGVEIVNDYSYFLPTANVFSVADTPFEATAFCPIADLTLEEYGKELLSKGEAAPDNSLDYCLANEEFFEKYGWGLLGKTIDVSSRFVLTYEGKQNERYVEMSMKVVGVVNEFGFLNSSRVYYSYQGLQDKLSEIYLDGSDGQVSSVRELVDLAEGNDQIASYSWMIFAHDEKGVETLFSLIENPTDPHMKVSSESQGLKASFSSLSEAFGMSLVIFVGISIVSVAAILGMAGFSSLVEGRKENAILQAIGAKRSDITFIYSAESSFLCLISSALALALSPLFAWLANLFLEREFDIPRLIRIPYQSIGPIPYVLIWGTLLVSAVYGFLAVLIPLVISKGRPLAEELHDE